MPGQNTSAPKSRQRPELVHRPADLAPFRLSAIFPQTQHAAPMGGLSTFPLRCALFRRLSLRHVPRSRPAPGGCSAAFSENSCPGTIASELFPTYHRIHTRGKDPCRVGFATPTPPAALPSPARPGELRPFCASSRHAGGLFFRAGFGRKNGQRRPCRRALCRGCKTPALRRRVGERLPTTCLRRTTSPGLRHPAALPAGSDILEDRKRGKRQFLPPFLSRQGIRSGPGTRGKTFAPPRRAAPPPSGSSPKKTQRPPPARRVMRKSSACAPSRASPPVPTVPRRSPPFRCSPAFAPLSENARPAVPR